MTDIDAIHNEPGWKTSPVKCRICGEFHISVYPTDIVDECAQECHKCGHKACEPVDHPDDEV